MGEEGEGDECHTNRPEGCCRHLVLHPLSLRRSLWDFTSLALVLYDMVMIPMGFFDPPETPFILAMVWITRCFWTLDMPMSFISGYVAHDGTVELRPSKIPARYLRSWFFLDLVVVASDWAEELLSRIPGMGLTRGFKASRIFRIVRLVRLLRLARMGEIFNLMLERLPSDILVVFGDILKLIIAMLGVGHFVACLWYAVGEAGPEGLNWIEDFGYTSPQDLDMKYIMSLRWALSQFAGGMDEVTPVSFQEHLFAVFVYIMAFWSGTVFLSILTSHMTQLYIMGSQQTQQLSLLRRYLHQHGVSRGLALRAQRNASHVMHAQQRTMSEQAVGLMELVSQALRIELHYEMYSPALSLHPFFADYMRECPHIVRKICHAALSMSANSVGDVIFHFGESASSMFIVKSGQLKYTWGGAGIYHTDKVEEGMWISEAALWVQWAHRGMLTVVEDSIIFTVNAESFRSIVGQFQMTSFDPAEYAQIFVDRLNKAEEEPVDLDIAGQSIAKGRSVWRRSRSTVGQLPPGPGGAWATPQSEPRLSRLESGGRLQATARSDSRLSRLESGGRPQDCWAAKKYGDIEEEEV